MFKKIMFATSVSPASDNAAKVAFDLARRNNARLYVFHVLGVPSRGFSQVVRDIRTGEDEQVDTDYRDWVLEEMRQNYAEQLKVYGEPDVVLQTSVGVPATEVLRFARQEGIDLIVIGANTREEDPGSTRVRSVIGSTMDKVAKAARCPVLIVNRPCTTCWNLFSNIVFSTDFSKPADAAFKFAYNTAKAVGAKLYLFHACDLSSRPLGVYAGQVEIERQLEKARKMMHDKYISRMTDYDNYEMEVWEGTPYVEILKLARARQADLIVMAHHTREADDAEGEIGSTVEQVVLRSACPVASVTHGDMLGA